MSVAQIAWNTPLQRINAFANQDSYMILCQRLASSGCAVLLTQSTIRFKEVPIVSLAQCGRPVMARTDVSTSALTMSGTPELVALKTMKTHVVRQDLTCSTNKCLGLHSKMTHVKRRSAQM